VGNTVLLIQLNGTLSCLIADNVAMGQVLSNDARSRLLFLGDLITVTLSLCSEVASVILVRAGGAGDLDVGCAKLGVVEEESGLGSGFLFEGYRCVLGLACGLDFDAGDLTAVGESVLIGQGVRTIEVGLCSLFEGLKRTRRRRSP
jgi:hypothetical protein